MVRSGKVRGNVISHPNTLELFPYFFLFETVLFGNFKVGQIGLALGGSRRSYSCLMYGILKALKRIVKSSIVRAE